MGDIRMSRRQRARQRVTKAADRLRAVSALAWSRIGYTGGCMTAASGVGVRFGLGWALMTAGVLAAASFLLLVDVGATAEGKGEQDA